jgi:hypothetical protein
MHIYHYWMPTRSQSLLLQCDDLIEVFLWQNTSCIALLPCSSIGLWIGWLRLALCSRENCWFELTVVTLTSFLLLGITCSNSYLLGITCSNSYLWLLEHHVTVLCRVRTWVVPTLNSIRHCKEHKHYGMLGHWNRSCCLLFRFSQNVEAPVEPG